MLLQMPSNHILIINIIEQENIDDSYNKMFIGPIVTYLPKLSTTTPSLLAC